MSAPVTLQKAGKSNPLNTTYSPELTARRVVAWVRSPSTAWRALGEGGPRYSVIEWAAAGGVAARGGVGGQ